MDAVRMALIGVGTMGKKYADMIASGKVPKMKLTAVVIRREEMLEWGSSLGADIYRSTDELFAHPEGYDAVLIVTPHKTHEKLAKQAFALDKHVLCDKPAAVNLSAAESMSAAAAASGKIYGMVFHQRLYSKYAKLKQLIESGELGELKRMMMVNSRYFRTARYHSEGWRSSFSGEGGGALINQGQHILDIWQWLFGMPESIYADIPFGKYNAFDVDDEATISMRYASGATGVFMISTGEAVWEERLEVVGTKGRVLLENNVMTIERHEEIGAYIKNADVNSREKLEITSEVIDFGKTVEPYSEMLANFAEACICGRQELLAASGFDAVKPLQLTCGAYYSAWSGARVSLPLRPDLYDVMFAEKTKEE